MIDAQGIPFGRLVPPTLAECVSMIESGNRPHAIRFERMLFDHDLARNDETLAMILLRIMRTNACSRDTACMIAATSWGQYQLLGVNLYSTQVGWITDIGTFLGSSTQQAMFNLFCRWRGIDPAFDPRDDAQRRNFAKIYNGPDAIDVYADRLLHAYQLMTGP